MRNSSGFFPAKKEMGGPGIGLSITSDIVKAHGAPEQGRSGKGVTFFNKRRNA